MQIDEIFFTNNTKDCMPNTNGIHSQVLRTYNEAKCAQRLGEHQLWHRCEATSPSLPIMSICLC